MKTLIVIAALLMPMLCTAQIPTGEWCEKNNYSAWRFYRGDTIVVSCDTVLLINLSTYRLYADAFKTFNTKNADLKRLASLFDQSRILYENRITEQDHEYRKLRTQFEELVKTSQSTFERTADKLNTVDVSLQRIDKNVESAQNNIEEARRLIRQEIRLGNWQRVKWGIGGLVIGAGITAVCVAIVD